MTTETLTDEMIEDLRAEAITHGDGEQVTVSRIALGDGRPTATTPDRETARRQCAEAITEGRARAWEPEDSPLVTVVA